jgi:RimJ/RimL family protein N-acetyltransferase
VQLKTDLRNERSQKAIERIGAKKEGVLRNHMILPDGYYRHSVFYSILDTEWLEAKQKLEEMMAR